MNHQTTAAESEDPFAFASQPPEVWGESGGRRWEEGGGMELFKYNSLGSN